MPIKKGDLLRTVNKREVIVLDILWNKGIFIGSLKTEKNPNISISGKWLISNGCSLSNLEDIKKPNRKGARNENKRGE